MTALRLVRSRTDLTVYRDGAHLVEHVVESGHPPLPSDDVLALMRRWVYDDRPGFRDEPLRWRHRSGLGGGPWAAVTDLHQHGRHDDAVGLARLLHWCDQRSHDEAHSWALLPADDEALGVSS